jgi:tetratricopeptide (TPR) repeat protein/energy-coupling factor transporter ATP-binding protein EcfA2
MTPDPAITLEDIRLEEHVASGGMGEVWRGVHLPSGQRVAVKRLLPGHDSSEYRARLRREIEAFQLLRHENIVRCLGSGLDSDGCPYLILEWLEGETLAQRWRRRPLDHDEIVDLARQALLGLAACHESSVVHRDIKPGNIFLVQAPFAQQTPSRTTIKLLDFGLAFVADEASRLTRAGTILGTLHYLSPEQARANPDIDHRADLYALGVVLYELGTGRLPFHADGTAAVLLKIIAEKPPRPRQIRPDMPVWLERVILRAMARDPDRRYPDADQMRRDIERGASDVTLSELPDLEPTSSAECRLVCLLCVRPPAGGESTPGRDGAEAPGQTASAAAVAEIETAGGVVHPLLSGEIVGLFGLEHTEGDEARRAVEAALEVRRRCGEARLVVSTVRLEVGEGMQLNGDELDRAVASLSGAPVGEVVVDLPTREQLSATLQTEFTAGRHVVTVLAEGRTRRQTTALVGRESELASIRAIWRRTMELGEPEAVLVVGPAGIGKSRLCLDLQAELCRESATLLQARPPRQNSPPYGLLSQVLTRAARIPVGQDEETRRRRLVRFLDQQLGNEGNEEAASFIGECIGVPFPESPALRVARAEPQVMRERVTGAIGDLLRATGARGPVVLHLDDVHHADRESLALLEQLMERLEQTPLFVLAAARPEVEQRFPGLFSAVEATRITLRPLGRRALRRLLTALWGAAFSRDLDQLVLTWSEGNPYFAEELASWLVARGAVERTGVGWELVERPTSLQLPAGIQGAIQGRLDHLSPELKELLKAAAIVGEVFWEDACEVMGHADAGPKLRRLEHEGFVAVRPDSQIAGTREWAFRHALLHQVATQMLPKERRRPLHLSIARWLEDRGETDSTLLSFHYEQGGDPQRAALHHGKAAAKALADGHPEQAVDWYRAALGVPPGSLTAEERRSREFGLARALITLSRYDEARDVLDRLSGAEGAVEGERLLLRGRMLLGTGRHSDAEAALREAIDLLERSGSALGFDARHALFWVSWVQGRYRDAGPIAAELLREACAAGSRPERLCSAKLALAYYCAVAGDLAASVRLAREAVEHAREVGHPYREVDALTLLGSARELVGLYDEALSSLDDAHTLALRLGTTFQQASIRASQGRICLTLGRIVEAIDRYDEAVERATAAGGERTLIAALAGRARARAAPGPERDPDLARQDAEAALQRSGDQASPSKAEALLACASVSLASGDLERSVHHALEAVALLDRLGTQERFEVEILLVSYRALSAAGRPGEARRLLERAGAAIEDRARRIGEPEVRERFQRAVVYNREVKELLASEG